VGLSDPGSDPARLSPDNRGSRHPAAAQVDESFDRVFDTPVTMPMPTKITQAIRQKHEAEKMTWCAP
jgi:hypothetical protein